jgi:hypothetical protein
VAEAMDREVLAPVVNAAASGVISLIVVVFLLPVAVVAFLATAFAIILVVDGLGLTQSGAAGAVLAALSFVASIAVAFVVAVAVYRRVPKTLRRVVGGERLADVTSGLAAAESLAALEVPPPGAATPSLAELDARLAPQRSLDVQPKDEHGAAKGR